MKALEFAKSNRYEVRWIEGEGVRRWVVVAESWEVKVVNGHDFVVFYDDKREIVLAVKAYMVVALIVLGVQEKAAPGSDVECGGAAESSPT